VFVSSSTSGIGILKWNGTTFVSVYASGYNWRYWVENQNKIFVLNDFLSGQLKYDPIANTFTVYRADYTGKPFAGDLTFFSDTNTTGRMYNNAGAAVLYNIFSEQITKGAYAYAVSVDRTQLLYSKPYEKEIFNILLGGQKNG